MRDTAPSTGRRSRRRGERGSALVEAAIVTPLLFLLLYGVMEAGNAYFGRETVNNMSVVGARTGSGEANDVSADYAILQAVRGAASGITPSTIKLIVVYRATAPGDRVPTACLTAPVTNSSSTRGCNRYVGTDLTLAADQFGCVGPPGPTTKIDNYWCPTTRKTAVQGSHGPPDYIGVYVKVDHQNLIGIMGKSFLFTSDTVIRIEPRTLT